MTLDQAVSVNLGREGCSVIGPGPVDSVLTSARALLLPTPFSPGQIPQSPLCFPPEAFCLIVLGRGCWGLPCGHRPVVVGSEQDVLCICVQHYQAPKYCCLQSPQAAVVSALRFGSLVGNVQLFSNFQVPTSVLSYTALFQFL